jgi:WD40 repeat protein
MSADDHMHPQADAWVAAIHESRADYAPLGAGIVIDARRVLTCAHVVRDVAAPWVSFPKASTGDSGARRMAERIVFPDAPAPVKDLAVLVLAGPVPAGVTPAPLRCPEPAHLVGRRWWAFGFPPGDPLGLGSSADGEVGLALGHGWIRLDTASRYPVERGFSGGGLWSPDYQAVVAVVSSADDGTRGDGRAITLHQADRWLPAERLRVLAERFAAADAGGLALAAWGWSLSGDPERRRHWSPRARGVSVDSEQGYRFRGRSAALRAITGWLGREHIDRRVLVVTGAPGAGKSAVLGRIVTTADDKVLRELPGSDTAVRATPGSVACAVHAKGATALEISAQIAKAASAALPDRVEDLVPALRDALAGRNGRRFNLVIDALDEAESPVEARTLVSKVIVPLAETCADVGAQVIIGSRRSDADGDLLAAFGGSAKLVDLDVPEFFAEEDLAAYAHATLQLAGDERPGNPYADDAIAAPVAARIARLSGANFLVAGLTARTHGLYDKAAADPAALSFSPRADDAMRQYLRRLSPAAEVPAEIALTALALAEAPGLSLQLWRAAVQALGARSLSTQQLARFANSAAASFLVESSGDGRETQFRLFHQALNDALLRARSKIIAPDDDERAIVSAFAAIGRERGWSQAPGYLLRSLPSHAVRAGMIDDLLADDAYLLHADLGRLMPLADRASSPTGRERARLLRLTPRAITAGPSARTALFSVTETLEDLGRGYTTSHLPAPYRAKWAAVSPRTEWSTLEGHTNWANGLCTFSQDGRDLLASGGSDSTVRIWDPATGTERAVLHGQAEAIMSVCALTYAGHALLASGGSDGTVQIWDPATGTEHAILHANAFVEAMCALSQEGRTALASSGGIWDIGAGVEHALSPVLTGRVSALCSFSQDGRILLAVGAGHVVRVWDVATGTEQAILRGHTGWITGVCAFTQAGRTLLASSADQTVRIWDPATAAQLAVLQHGGWIRAVCALTLDDRTLLASGSADYKNDDWAVRIWDPATAAQLAVLHGHTDMVKAVCALTLDGRTLLASGSQDGTVRIWDPRTAIEHNALGGAGNMATALCGFALDGRALLASSRDGTLYIRDASTGAQLAVLHGHTDTVRAVCALTVDGRTLLASGSGDLDDAGDWTVRIWDPATGAQLAVLRGHTDLVTAVCAFTLDGRTLLASGSDDWTVRIWDPATSTQLAVLHGHTISVTAVCAFTLDGRTLLASGGHDRAVRIWDPATSTQLAALHGHADAVTALCAFTVDGRTLLASGGDYDDADDRTVRIWDPATGAQLAVLRGHTGAVTAVSALTVGGRTLLASGSGDRTVRIWDPATATALLTVPVHHPVLALDSTCGPLIALVTAGLLAIQISHLQ